MHSSCDKVRRLAAKGGRNGERRACRDPGDPSRQTRVIQQSLQFGFGNRWPGAPERELRIDARPGREHPPGRALAEGPAHQRKGSLGQTLKRTMTEFSEDNGYFQSDNLVGNDQMSIEVDDNGVIERLEIETRA